MPSTAVEKRLPCYEDHLILNSAILVDAPQTSSGAVWSERWCSLEDGRLLVYIDRTAAMIDPEDTCAVIDVHSFACVQPSLATSDHAYAYELVLSTTPPEPIKSNRLFRPRSAMSLNRLQAEPMSRQDSLDLESRSSMASVSRMSFQSRPLNPTQLSHISANTDTPDLATASNPTKPWSKFGFGSRRLYAKLSSSSSGSLRISHNLPSQSASTTSSLVSSIDPRASTDMISSGAPSPRTPLSATFGAALESVHIRATSASSYNSWLDALSLTIKMHNDTALAPSPMLKQYGRMPTRPSLSNLPGFRTPTILQASPTLPSTETCVDPAAQDVTPKASRKRHSSAASLSFALTASRQMQGTIFDRSAGSAPNLEKHVSDDEIAKAAGLNDHITFSEPRKRRPSTADALASAASHIFGAKDANGAQQQRKHKRSISTASSSFSLSTTSRPSDQRRNSISGSQLLASGSQTLSPSQQLDTSFQATASFPPPISTDLNVGEPQEAVKPTSEIAAQTASRHRRSGSVLKFGSARILAWRDTFTAVNSTATADTLTGLGLQVEEGDSNAFGYADGREIAKTAKGLSGFKSLRSLTKSKGSIRRDIASSYGRRAESVSFALPNVATDSQRQAAPQSAQSTVQSKSKGMSRSTSLLSITKSTFASLRERSSSRQSIRTVFAAPSEEVDAADQTQDSGSRIQSADCDFSYELVHQRLGADATEGYHEPSFSVADESRVESTADVKRQGDADDSMAERLAAMKFDPSLGQDKYRTTSPTLPRERILPPRHIIDTFDKLRAADPTGRSCDWLSHIEACGRRGSLDWEAATSGARRPSLRAAASQTFASRGASMDLLTSRRLRSSISAWDLAGASPNIGEMADGKIEEDGARGANEQTQPEAPRMSAEVVDTPPTALRSLPAPPRAYKRRARVSSCQSSKPVLAAPAATQTAPASTQTIKATRALTDLTNIPHNINTQQQRSSGKLDAGAELTKMRLTPPPRSPRSPRRLGALSSKRSAGRVVG